MKRKFPVAPIILFVFIFALFNLYAISAISPLLSTSVSFWLWTIPLTILVFVGLSLIKIDITKPSKFFQVSAHILLVDLVSILVFATSLFVIDFWRLASATIHSFKTGNFHLEARTTVGIYVGIALFFFTVLAFVYGMLKGKYAYRVIKHTLHFDDLPDGFNNFKIVQISDVHAGSLKRAKAVQKGINLINQQQADLFVFTGDLVNNKADEITPFIEQFAEIKAPFGQFSILGNHDYGDYIPWPSEKLKEENLIQLKNYHRQIGFRLLLDEHIVLEKGEQRISLLGIENWGLGFGQRGDLAKALGGTTNTDFKILLSHDPSHWEAQVKDNPANIHLTLAGHTHGMQFGLEAFGIKWSPVKYRYKHWAGIKKEYNRYLNVNRGFGFLGFSGRVGIWPEITVIELKKS
jgi:hypothetical protein